MDPRTAAVAVLVQVISQGRFLDAALKDVLPKVADPRDRALAQELCFGVLRWGPRLEALAAQLLHKPLDRRDSDIQCLILIGLYQLIYSRVPAHAAVGETVNAAERLNKPWARGLINALLRRFQRERGQLLERLDRIDTAAFAHPDWLIAAIREDWPEDWKAILEENNQRPPMWLRINRLRGTRDSYLQELQTSRIHAAPSAYVESAIRLEQPLDVASLPGFGDGRVSVQDASAQLAAELIDVHAGMRVADLCAAPGGKTAHLLECEPLIAALVAVERSAERMERVKETLTRLGLRAEVINADAAETGTWWDGIPFDRILLDAPCSATGVIRRHPDIKRLRRPEDIETLSTDQSRLLDAAWPLVAEGGMLLYATCSIMHRENDRQIEAFLARHADARERPIDAPWGRSLSVGRQILPGEGDMDGFYYACIDKRPDRLQVPRG